MKKQAIFATPFWHIDGAPQQLVDELYKGAYVCKESVESNVLSNQGGYQSPSFNWDQFHPEGIKYIDKILSDILKPLDDSNYDGEYTVQSWWYNINSKGNSNSPHTHPASDYALVFYLTDTENRLVLMNPNPRFVNSVASRDIAIPHTNKGDVLIFPADIIHYVLPNEKEDDRICISMNISIRDKYS